MTQRLGRGARATMATHAPANRGANSTIGPCKWFAIPELLHRSDRCEVASYSNNESIQLN